MPDRVLIAVKTYPTLSRKYGELVCTAGLREDGRWVRIYPVPFRKLESYQQFEKWTWVELDLAKNTGDPRPESYRPVELGGMRLLQKVPTADGWAARRAIVEDQGTVYDDIGRLIEMANKENSLSLATFRPAAILDLQAEEVDRDWDQDTIAILRDEARQGNLFDTPEQLEADFRAVPKVPYRFSYRFRDVRGRESTLMIEDWEIGQLYWNCLNLCGRDEREAVAKVREKYLTTFGSEHDVLLFLGTTRRFHGRAPNPFIIVGVFYPPRSTQLRLGID